MYEWINEWSTLSIGKMMTDKTKSTWRGERDHHPTPPFSLVYHKTETQQVWDKDTPSQWQAGA